MAKQRNSTGPLYSKLSGLAVRYLDEKTRENKRKAPENNEFENIVLIKNVKFNDLLIYSQQKDLSLQRVKKVLLEKTLQKVVQDLVEEEQEEIDEMNANNDEIIDEISDLDNTENADELMEVKDDNSLNKSVVNLWNLKKPEVATPPTEVVVQEVKKRSKESSSRSSKKQKTEKDRTPPTSSLSQLGGMDDVVAQLLELIGMPILHTEIYQNLGIEPPRGVLLHGPPGCGKTSIANALAGDLKVPFISISAPSVVSGMSGESEKKLRELFDEAKSLAPCLLFFDEIDAITPKREGAQREMERRIVAQMLTCIDELSLDKTGGKPVIIIGATNRPDSLDPALRRAGRFDREICLNVPNEESRFHILKKMTENLKIDGELNFKQLAKMTPGYVGADLKALTTAAGACAIQRIFKHLLVNDDVNNKFTELSIDNLATSSISLKIIQNFLNSHPEPLNEQQLSLLNINFQDFLTALPTIQPTSKREGFATVPDVTWDNVGALSSIRLELNMAIVQPIKNPQIFEKVGIHAPSGVLMWGPPGCGKTLLAKAVANESRANFISIKGPELLNKYVGESEKAIRQVFTRARSSIPCVIFFDELDALVPRRDSTLSESSSRVVNTLLTELDGLNDRKGIFVIGATNRPDMIDPAMLRPGRLDKTLFIELPNALERFEILKTVVKTNKTPISPDINLEQIANDYRCRNFSGADLNSLIRESGVLALKRNFLTINRDIVLEDEKSINEKMISITKDDIENALNIIKPSVNDRDRLKYDKLNKKMGWSLPVEKEDETKKDDEVLPNAEPSL